MKIFQIGLTPLGYFYQRLSKMINKLTPHQSRYYTNTTKWRNSPYLDPDHIDLTQDNTKEEILNLLKRSDTVFIHQCKNYFRNIVCRDGEIPLREIIRGKRIFIFIHGQPESLPENINSTNEFIHTYSKKITFFVTTVNQLNLFVNVELFPIAGLWDSNNEFNRPYRDYLKISQIKITRCSDWKASMFDNYLMNKLFKPSNSLPNKLKRMAIYYFPLFRRKYDGILTGKINGFSVKYNNLTKVRPHRTVLNYLRNTDILLENDFTDYPGGGTTHTIGLEGLSVGTAIINGATKANMEVLASWLGTDKLPPFPNWNNEKDFYLHHIDYLNRLIKDKDYLIEMKKRSRKYFEQFLCAEKVMPKFLKLIEKK